MHVLAFFATYGVLQACWVTGALAASELNILTVAQMQLHPKKEGCQKGMPYLWHFGMWNDVVTIHPWAALMVGLYGSEWLSLPYRWVVLVALLSIAISWGANAAWARGTKSHVEAHGWYGEMSDVGIVHIVHMTVVTFIVLMSAWWIIIGDMPWALALGSICLLLAHACIGTHWPLRLFNPPWNPHKPGKHDAAIAILNAVFLSLALLLFFVYLLNCEV